MSSAVLPGVPLSSRTVTFVSVTSPQLVTTPLKGMLVVPKGTVPGQVLVTRMQGVVGTVVVQLLLGLSTWPPQTLSPEATIVSVSGPQKFAPTVCVPEYGALPPTGISGRLSVMSSAVLPGVPLSSTTLTFVSGTLPQLVTMPLKGMLVVPNETVAGQVLVASIHGLLQTLQVALAV